MTAVQPASATSTTISRRHALGLLGFAGAGVVLGTTLARASTDADAPSLAGVQPGHYRFTIGDIEALAVNDGGFAVTPSESPFGIGEPREKVTEALRDALAPTDMMRLPFNVLLMRIGSELVMVDTGCGPTFGAVGGRLVANLAAAGVKPEQITAIIITHLHGDHFGGLLDANGEVVFKNAGVFMHRVEHDYWASKGDETVSRYLKVFDGKWQLIAGGDKLLGGLEIVETFGHTPGHLAIGIRSGSDYLLHLVDVVHSHVLSFAHPEWVMKFDVQPQVAIATRKAAGAYEYLIEPWVSA